ncbi:hypothetical protein TorRG33x02_256700 [Trema orientale]|uniref:Uncharacterized protein n=1 Tax=Trema orientale TaxID=63057 RepID=A0A2P5DB47_TREOI|nr:hypothetical protein TorRG33x02_256700 [Trema orientale]
MPFILVLLLNRRLRTYIRMEYCCVDVLNVNDEYYNCPKAALTPIGSTVPVYPVSTVGSDIETEYASRLGRESPLSGS